MSALGRYGSLLIGALALAACQEKSQGTAPAVSAAPVASVAPAQVADDQIAIPADFEEQAAKDITEDNADQELSKLEQEVSKE